MKYRSLAFHLKLGLQQIFPLLFQSFQSSTIGWTLGTRPRRDKMSDLPFSIKNILSGNIAKKEHLQWHFCPIFSRCPWTYVPRIQLSSSSSKKVKKVKRSVFSKDQVAKLGKELSKAGKGGFHLRFSGFCPLRGYPPPTPLTENQCEKKKVFFLNGIGGYPPPP